MEMYKNGYCFDVAREEDILGIIGLESKYFSEKIAYKEEDIRRWLNHNRNMIYVVRDTENRVKAFTIIVPISFNAYNKFKDGKLTDMDKIDLEDIGTSIKSDYYYFADVVSDDKNPLSSMIIFRNILPILINNAKYIVTTPVTNEGRNKAKKLGAININNGDDLSLNEPCYIDVASAEVIANKMITVIDKAMNRR